ncbi:hypothetical protein SAMN05421770_107109 [Granulicella rosea]|uniref:Uncharacterized protein n=1 Tax=Granulicella rosea TaxID=474952 RepID=A0A239LMN8_9BACT|nr:hypothetical protein SAMN05421770_107109 [Granulicella rosea]
MKKITISAVLLLMTTSAFARPCKVWKVRHHHRVCVRR